MIEEKRDLWSYVGDATIICITTNGIVKTNGEGVMGRGCAKEAADRFPRVPWLLGQSLVTRGNVPWKLGHIWNASGLTPFWPSDVLGFDINQITNIPGSELWTFPVKWHWQHPADTRLIVQSAKLLVYELDRLKREDLVVIPRPGCGNGKLSWEQVQPLLSPILDDRFILLDRP